MTYDPLEDDEALARLEQAVLADADKERQMAEHKWIISGDDKSVTGGPAGVSTREDLDRRLEAAKKAGVDVTVREVK